MNCQRNSAGRCELATPRSQQRCAIEVQTGLIERNAGVPPERRIEFRVGIHLGDVVEESDGDLMGLRGATNDRAVDLPASLGVEGRHRSMRERLFQRPATATIPHLIRERGWGGRRSGRIFGRGRARAADETRMLALWLWAAALLHR